MNGLSNLFVGVAGSVIATILTSLVWLALSIYKRYSRRDGLLPFLGVTPSKETWVCYGNVHKERVSNFTDKHPDDYATFEYGDIASVLLVYDRLRSTPSVKIKHSVGNDLDGLSGNVVSIGGPKWNKVAEKLLGKLGSPLYFKSGTQGIVEKRRTHHSENVYAAEIKSQPGSSLQIKDYGFIICSRAHFFDHNITSAVVIAGFTTFGVLLATEFLIRMSPSEITSLGQRIRNDKRFGFLIEGSLTGDEKGRLVVSEDPKLISLIPEQDFVEPYSYTFSQAAS